MQTGDPHLLEFIRSELATRGPLPFAWFMEQALYHPQHGYYGSGRCEIGRNGDYFTNVSVGPLFGRLLTAQFAEMWDALGRESEFAIVEQGAHGGELAHDVLTAAQAEHPDFFRALRYIIVEPFPIWREQQDAKLAAFTAKICWHSALEELAPFRGVHFSNELLDAMRVHLVRWIGTDWVERQVTEVHGALAFVDLPISEDALTERVHALPRTLPTGYETEVNLAASQWIATLAGKLLEGFVLTIDYGWPRDEFYAPQRTTGTMRCYSRHRVVPSPLQRVGQADISAHVEWTTLIEHAEKCGLTLGGFTDQHHFITGILAGNPEREFAKSSDPKTQRALQTLLHPAQLGMKFQFMVLEKNLRQPARLSGLRYAKSEPLK